MKVGEYAVRYCEFVSPFFFVLKIIILKELFIFILSVQEFCLQVCKCAACVPGTMDALDLELLMVVSCHLGVQNL